MANLYSGEKSTISFDDKEIEVSSIRRAKKIFLISQLKKVTCQKYKYLESEHISVSIRIEKKILPQYRISSSKDLFSSNFRKKNFATLLSIFDSFHEQILQTQFKQVTSKLVTLPLTFIQKN